MSRNPAEHLIDDRIRVQHMLDAARDVVRLAAGRCRDDLALDMPFRRATVNAIQEIGEAGARVSPAGRAMAPAIPWQVIVGMRNRLVHGYDQIDYEVVWLVVTEEAPSLIALIEAACVGWPMPEPPQQ